MKGCNLHVRRLLIASSQYLLVLFIFCPLLGSGGAHEKGEQRFYPHPHASCETTLPSEAPPAPSPLAAAEPQPRFPTRPPASSADNSTGLHFWLRSSYLQAYERLRGHRSCGDFCPFPPPRPVPWVDRGNAECRKLQIWWKSRVCSLFCFRTILTGTQLHDALGLQGFCLFFTAKCGCRNGGVWAPCAGSSHIFELDNKAGEKQLIHKRDRLDSAPSVWLNLVLAFPMGL